MARFILIRKRIFYLHYNVAFRLGCGNPRSNEVADSVVRNFKIVRHDQIEYKVGVGVALVHSEIVNIEIFVEFFYDFAHLFAQFVYARAIRIYGVHMYYGKTAELILQPVFEIVYRVVQLHYVAAFWYFGMQYDKFARRSVVVYHQVVYAYYFLLVKV